MFVGHQRGEQRVNGPQESQNDPGTQQQRQMLSPIGLDQLQPTLRNVADARQRLPAQRFQALVVEQQHR